MKNTAARFEFGDRVRHPRRPEWGTGSVTAVETIAVNGGSAQRVSVRFHNAGLKTLSTAHVDLERLDAAEPTEAGGPSSGLAEFRAMEGADWLAGVADQKIREVMIELPLAVRDPFNSIRRRLEMTIDLYRFDASGKGLIEWAVVQSGMDDPLTRFSRQELEQFFDRWSAARENHLQQLIAEAPSQTTRALLATASPAARLAVERASSDTLRRPRSATR